MTKFPSFHFDEARQEAFVSGRHVHLGPKERELLRTLMAEPRAWTREELLHGVWKVGRGIKLDTRTVDQHMSRLRRKLNAPIVETVPGVGYKIGRYYAGIGPVKSPDDRTRTRMVAKLKALTRAMDDFRATLIPAEAR